MIDVKAAFRWAGNAVIDTVMGEIDQRLHQVGSRWLSIAQGLAPVDTGELRAGLYYRVENRTLVLGGTAGHTLFVDRGTRNMAGRWFIENALHQVEPLFGAGLTLEFNVPHIASPVIAHQGRMIAPSGIQPRPLTREQHRRVQANQAAYKRHHRGNVKRAKVVVRRFS